MKNRLILLSILLISSSVIFAQKNEITIRGSVQFPRDGEYVKIILSDGFSQTTVDSIKMDQNKTFSKRVRLPKAGRYMLVGHDQRLFFWGEDEDIEVNMRGVDTAKMRMIMPTHIPIENSGPNNELMNLISFFSYTGTMDMYRIGNEIYRAKESGEKEWIEYSSAGYDRNRDFSRDLFDYLGKNYKDRNSAISLLSMLSPDVKKIVTDYFEKNKPDYPPYVEYKEAEAYKIAQQKKLANAQIAPDFAYSTPDGKKIGPKDFRGKYLLLDFWASWCGPCRKSIPHLKELYAKYKDMGLEILSVSIDRGEKAWLDALKSENMPWTQILAPESGKEVQKIYQFSGIPHVLLLDREGRIIARELYGEDIDKELQRVFGK